MTNNYVRYDGELAFFDDRNDRSRDSAFALAVSARKACVWRRPSQAEWLSISVVGEVRTFEDRKRERGPR